MPALLDDQDIRIVTLTFADVGKANLTSDLAADDHSCLLCLPTDTDKFVREPYLFIDLKCPRLHADRFRVRCSRLLFVDDDEVDAVTDELGRERESGRSRTDYDHVS